MIIAVDGPTASGKGTIAKALAAHFGLPHLDTGLLYRAVGRQVFLDGGDPDDGGDALAGCAFPDTLLNDPQLRDRLALQGRQRILQNFNWDAVAAQLTNYYHAIRSTSR